MPPERISLAIAVTAAALSTSTADAQRFASTVEAVRVDVLVTENGSPVSGLSASDFQIRDNGVLQTVDLVAADALPLNIVLALDVSSSLDGERLDELKNAAAAVIDGLKPAEEAGLVTFSHAVQSSAALTSDVSRVRAAIDRVKASGATALVDGVFVGQLIAESGAGRPLLVVFSDGADTASWLAPERVLETVRRSDTVVYAVSAGRQGNRGFLAELSHASGGSLFEVESTRDVRAVFGRILEEFRHRYIVSFVPRGVARAGWHTLDVRIKDRKAVVKARPGYLAGS